MTNIPVALTPMTSVHSISSSGEVVGYSTIVNSPPLSGSVTTNITNGVIWQGGAASLLSAAAGTQVPVIYLEDVNSLGEIAGSENQNTAGQLPVLWADGTATILGLTAGDTNGLALTLNDFGVAAGFSVSYDSFGNSSASHAVLWQNGGATVLPALAGDGGGAVARAINDSDLVVGSSSGTALLADQTRVSHAVEWNDGAVSALATLPGELSSTADAVNLAGQIAGTVQFAAGSDAVLWQNGAAQDLGALPGFSWTGALDVNDFGQVVGGAWVGDPYGANPGAEHAFLWQNGVFTDLNSLLPANSGWILQEADAINDAGWIVGDGTKNGVSATFLLTVGGNAAATAISAAMSAYQQGELSSPVSFPASAADVAADLDGLQSLAAAGKLGTVLLLDAGTPTLSVTDTQMIDDAGAWTRISGNFLLAAGTASVLHLGGAAAQYSVTVGVGGTLAVSGNGLAEQVPHAVALDFADYDEIVAAAPGTASVTTGNLTELYGAVLGRAPDVPGLVYYQDILLADPALPMSTFATWFLASPEYAANPAHDYAQTPSGDAQFITDTYNNLLHRDPAAGDVAWYLANVIDPILGNLTPGTAAYTAAETLAHAQVLVNFSASTEFTGDVQVTAQHPADGTHWLVLT